MNEYNKESGRSVDQKLNVNMKSNNKQTSKQEKAKDKMRTIIKMKHKHGHDKCFKEVIALKQEQK